MPFPLNPPPTPGMQTFYEPCLFQVLISLVQNKTKEWRVPAHSNAVCVGTLAHHSGLVSAFSPSRTVPTRPQLGPAPHPLKCSPLQILLSSVQITLLPPPRSPKHPGPGLRDFHLSGSGAVAPGTLSYSWSFLSSRLPLTAPREVHLSGTSSLTPATLKTCM